MHTLSRWEKKYQKRPILITYLAQKDLNGKDRFNNNIHLLICQLEESSSTHSCSRSENWMNKLSGKYCYEWKKFMFKI